ncbi:Hypothetical protein NTJ_14501 [Nesidiocoris tenuis]|uniref:Saposin B-type domain-containing protein n=1 Tax=Nesidiocoris tenuis TaxID=355587 RepID=A0ABN7BDD8_9HEMI|nr:Hypothetical protein NTJ_14501 [Nesidiocoris tenuis]
MEPTVRKSDTSYRNCRIASTKALKKAVTSCGKCENLFETENPQFEERAEPSTEVLMNNVNSILDEIIAKTFTARFAIEKCIEFQKKSQTSKCRNSRSDSEL